MLRLDDLTVRTAELNRTVAAIDRAAWMTTGANRDERTPAFGSIVRSLIARIPRNSPAATNPAPSPLRPA